MKILIFEIRMLKVLNFKAILSQFSCSMFLVLYSILLVINNGLKFVKRSTWNEMKNDQHMKSKTTKNGNNGHHDINPC